MRILLLTQFYWPEARSAPANLAAVAEFLQGEGNDVTVLTGFPNHPFGRIYDGYRLRWRQWEDVRGVRVLRVPLYADHSLSPLRRALHYCSFALFSATIGAWLTRNFHADVVLVYLPPITNWLPIRVLKLVHRVPVVYWITDLWPEALVAAGANLRPWQARAIQRLDDRVNRLASLILVNSPGLRRKLRDKGVAAERLQVITDWAEESLFFPVEPDARLAREHSLTGKFNVMYGGNLGPAQGLTTVVEAAELLQDLRRLQFVFVGDGEDKLRLEGQVAARGLTNVRFLPRQPMQEIRKLFALADVLLVHLRPDPMFELQIPSKTMAYMACGKPILCGIAGSAAEVVSDAGAGLCCDPGDAHSMATAVRALYRLPPEELAQLGKSGRETYLRKYTRAVQAKRFQAFLTEVVARKVEAG